MKKQFFNAVVFASVFSLHTSLCAHTKASEPVDNSGQDRIHYIMSQVKHESVPGCNEPITYITTSNISQDLNIPAIADFFDCTTVMGRAFLQESLQHPVSPADQSGIVEMRARAIRQLVENPTLKKQVTLILQQAAQQEITAMELMSNTFKGKTCPELKQLQVLKEQKNPLYGFANFMNTNIIPRAYATVTNVVSAPIVWAGAVNFAYLAQCSDHERRALGFYMDAGGCIGYSAYMTLVASLITYGLHDDLTKSGQKRFAMRSLNQLIRIAESIEQLSDDSDIAMQFKISLITDPAGIALVNGLKASRYQSKKDYCFNVPAVHTFLYNVYQNEEQLSNIFASIAEMDVYNAIATKIIASKKNQHSFCFAQTIPSTQPQVISQSFWNVLVPNAVTSSLAMDKHVILTGPNAGGKTTSIRAILQNIVLAQTYGVAAAEEFSFTQFDVLLSYLNISDDLINGYSLFASEIKRAKDLLETIKSLQSGQKLFFALDELFTGTAAEQGEKCAYEFIKKTATFDTTLFVYATHFDKLKDLGKHNNSLMNYKVDAPTKNIAGKLVYPYTISPGASTVNIAEDMAREAGLFD